MQHGIGRSCPAPGPHGRKFGNIAGLAFIVLGTAMVAMAAVYPTMDMGLAVMGDLGWAAELITTAGVGLAALNE